MPDENIHLGGKVNIYVTDICITYNFEMKDDFAHKKAFDKTVQTIKGAWPFIEYKLGVLKEGFAHF